jgi:hypothetical protein
MGLDHSKKPGMMGYHIRSDFFGFPLEDPHKLWLSIDDLAGLYHISN